jgi:hypothetical protein
MAGEWKQMQEQTQQTFTTSSLNNGECSNSDHDINMQPVQVQLQQQVTPITYDGKCSNTIGISKCIINIDLFRSISNLYTARRPTEAPHHINGR